MNLIASAYLYTTVPIPLLPADATQDLITFAGVAITLSSLRQQFMIDAVSGFAEVLDSIGSLFALAARKEEVG